MKARSIALLTGLALGLQTAAAHADDKEALTTTHHHGAAPWVVVSTGGASVIVGVLSFVGAVKAHDDAQADASAKGCSTSPVACPSGIDSSHLASLVDGEHAMNVLGVLFTAVGGAAVIGGLVWHFLEPGAKQVVVQPILGPSSAMLGVTGRF